MTVSLICCVPRLSTSLGTRSLTCRRCLAEARAELLEPRWRKTALAAPIDRADAFMGAFLVPPDRLAHGCNAGRAKWESNFDGSVGRSACRGRSSMRIQRRPARLGDRCARQGIRRQHEFHGSAPEEKRIDRPRGSTKGANTMNSFGYPVPGPPLREGLRC